MRYLKTKWWAAFLWAAAGGLFIAVGCVTAKDKTPSPPAPAATGSTLTPGANDARIAYITADLMENYQYSRQALDGDMSRKFYDGYIDSLDPRHENFLQSDLDEFAHYRTNMDAYIIGS